MLKFDVFNLIRYVEHITFVLVWSEAFTIYRVYGLHHDPYSNFATLNINIRHLAAKFEDVAHMHRLNKVDDVHLAHRDVVTDLFGSQFFNSKQSLLTNFLSTQVGALYSFFQQKAGKYLAFLVLSLLVHEIVGMNYRSIHIDV